MYRGCTEHCLIVLSIKFILLKVKWEFQARKINYAKLLLSVIKRMKLKIFLWRSLCKCSQQLCSSGQIQNTQRLTHVFWSDKDLKSRFEHYIICPHGGNGNCVCRAKAVNLIHNFLLYSVNAVISLEAYYSLWLLPLCECTHFLSWLLYSLWKGVCFGAM